MASSTTTNNNNNNSHQKKKNLEVEQKFAIDDVNDLQSRLAEAGFVEKGRVEMVDWYFDVPTANYPLIRQDCWLRYRSKGGGGGGSDDASSAGGGQWELKRGGGKSSKTKSKATVYEEIEGKDALVQTQELITSFQNTNNPQPSFLVPPVEDNLYQEYDIPQPSIEIVPALRPLARIAAFRSSWHSSETNVVVDLDATDFGHAVGEVETVVSDASQIEAAQQELQTWLQDLLGENSLQGPPPMGKLEFYLSTKRPEILEILVQAGLMPSRS